MVCTLGAMEINTKVNGNQTWDTETVLISSQTETATLVIMFMANQKVSASTAGLMDQFIKVNSRMGLSMDMVNGESTCPKPFRMIKAWTQVGLAHKLKQTLTKENTSKTRNTDKVSLNGKAAMSTKAHTMMMKGKVSVKWLGQMEVSTKELGNKAFRKVSV